MYNRRSLIKDPLMRGVRELFKFCMKVYGCQMNVYDADKIRTDLLKRGCVESKEEEADTVIYVGCSIRDKAEHKVWSQLGRHSDRWEQERKPSVAVLGCIAQNVGQQMAERFPWVQLIAGPRHIGQVPQAIVDMVGSMEERSLLDEDQKLFLDLETAPLRRDNPWKAFLTIAHGCDNFCTYCIVPYVRGRFMSRPPEEILDEARQLVQDGVKEITLLGQNVNSYGTDFKDGYRFSHLLRDVSSINGLRLLRFATSHPKDFTEDIVEVMAKSNIICPGINLPIQSGSDRIIKKMNRKYDLATYTATVEMIRKKLPDAGLTSDLIVGFPGETEEDFNDSVKALEKFRFDLVHTAAYSPREGTKAALMEDQVPEPEKKRRLNVINDLQSKIAFEINQQLVGKKYTLLVDDHAPKGDSLFQGRTPSDKVVLFTADENSLGRFAEVEIVRAEHWCLHGKILHFVD